MKKKFKTYSVKVMSYQTIVVTVPEDMPRGEVTNAACAEAFYEGECYSADIIGRWSDDEADRHGHH